jgi:7-cyano-7-deazaguanine reductase
MSNTTHEGTEKLTLLGHSKTDYPNTPDEARLEAFDNRYADRDYWIEFNCPEFTALCPMTGQPDFGHIIIRYIPDKLCVESKSLKLYLFAFRNHGTFHEEVVNRILDDVVELTHPRKAIVKGIFNPRGGISITAEATYSQA